MRNRIRLLVVFSFLLFTRFVFAADMKQAIEARMKEFKADTVGIYFETYDGNVFTYNADAVLHAASTMKVPVMMEVFHQVESGKLKLDQEIMVKNEFASIVDGSPFSLTKEDDSDLELYSHIGQEMPLSALLERMINSSSNLATNLIIQIVGAPNVMRLMSEIGAKDITVLRGVEDLKAFDAGKNNTTSARALATCLKASQDAKYFKRESSDRMFDILLSQKFKEIGDALKQSDPSLKVASKDGWITDIYHDAAIIRDSKGRGSIMVILTHGVSEEKQGQALIQALAKDLWTDF